jgi:hypothetical protein
MSLDLITSLRGDIYKTCKLVVSDAITISEPGLIEITGNYSTGKSLLCLHIAKQNPALSVGYIDAEASFNIPMFNYVNNANKSNDLNDRLLLILPPDIIGLLSMLEDLFLNGIKLIIIDSITVYLQNYNYKDPYLILSKLQSLAVKYTAFIIVTTQYRLDNKPQGNMLSRGVINTSITTRKCSKTIKKRKGKHILISTTVITKLESFENSIIINLT